MNICAVIAAILLIAPSTSFGTDRSVCFGTTDRGSLENGWQLPGSGINFEAYSLVGVAAGRNYVHSDVYQVVVESYSNLNQKMPDKKFLYGETGWKNGGKFRPHKSHQNGLSVDFFVPVVDKFGKSVFLPTNALNKFGYNIEFSNSGEYEGYIIDFDAMAEHLLELKKISDKNGIKIWRVIFDNELQKLLFATKKGSELRKQLQFSTKKPWVRHDEHYHVDFDVPCK